MEENNNENINKENENLANSMFGSFDEAQTDNASDMESSLFGADTDSIDELQQNERNITSSAFSEEPVEAQNQIEDILPNQEEELNENSFFEEAQQTREISYQKTSNIEPVVTIDESNSEETVKHVGSSSNEMVTVRPVKFQEFIEEEPNRTIKKNLDIMQDVSMHISVELGRTKSSIRDVMEMEKGSIVELDKIAGEQVEIFVNDKLVAKGEVIVIEDKFGVRVTSTNVVKVET